MDDALLISQVEHFVFLYNEKDPKFKNKIHRENAWKTISVILEQPPDACEQRWVVLRNNYNTLKREMKNMPSGSGGEGCVKWPLFNAMKFLDQFIVPRQTPTSPNMDVEDILPLEPLSDATSSSQSSDTNMGRAPKTPRPRAVYRRVKRREQEEDVVGNKISNAMEMLTNYVASRGEDRAGPASERSEEMFGKQVASDLMRINSEEDRMKIKRDIYDLFYNYFKNN